MFRQGARGRGRVEVMEFQKVIKEELYKHHIIQIRKV